MGSDFFALSDYDVLPFVVSLTGGFVPSCVSTFPILFDVAFSL